MIHGVHTYEMSPLCLLQPYQESNCNKTIQSFAETRPQEPYM